MNAEQEEAVRELTRVPGLSRGTAELLVRSGLLSIEDVAYVPSAELLSESGLLATQVSAVRASARSFLLGGSSG